jgi:hypothetical protein
MMGTVFHPGSAVRLADIGSVGLARIGGMIERWVPALRRLRYAKASGCGC